MSSPFKRISEKNRRVKNEKIFQRSKKKKSEKKKVERKNGPKKSLNSVKEREYRNTLVQS